MLQLLGNSKQHKYRPCVFEGQGLILEGFGLLGCLLGCLGGGLWLFWCLVGVLKASWGHFGAILGASWAHLGPPGEPKMHYVLRFFGIFQIALRSIEHVPSGSDKAPKGFMRAPRGPQEAPRRAQEGPKMAPRGPKRAPRRRQPRPKTAP